MTKAEAKRQANARAAGVMQSYLDAGSLYEGRYDDLPEDDINQIAAELQAMIARCHRAALPPDAQRARRVGSQRSMVRKGWI